MGYIIEISDSKVDKMSEYVEDMLWAGGELMHCLEKMKGEYGYGERGDSGSSSYGGSRYGMRSRYDNYGERGGRGGNYGSRMGYKDDEYDEEEWEMMGERRGRGRSRDSRGRYR